MERAVHIKLRIFGKDPKIHTRSFTLNKETNQYYLFCETDDEFSELSKIKKADFGKITSTNVNDSHSIFTRDAWVLEEDVSKTSQEMLELSKKHFNNIAKTVNTLVDELNKITLP